MDYCLLELWQVLFLLHMDYQIFWNLARVRFLSICKFTPELFVPIALLEVIGGLAILIGILTRIASALLIIEMLGAILSVKLSKGFVGGYEFELLLISICLSLVIMGPGRISVENSILRREIFPKGKQLYLQTSKGEIK